MKLSLSSELMNIQVDLSEGQIAILVKAAIDMVAEKAGDEQKEPDNPEDIVIEGFCAGQESGEPEGIVAAVCPKPRKDVVDRKPVPVTAGSGQKPEKGKLRKKGKPAADYWGFLHLICQTCGETKTTCVKKPLKVHRCENGHLTDLEEQSRRAAFMCECGKFWRYHTNARTDVITIPCPACETPTDLMWNGKKEHYEKMQ